MSTDGKISKVEIRDVCSVSAGHGWTKLMNSDADFKSISGETPAFSPG